MLNDKKIDVLNSYLKSLGNIAVAFSGGLDSTFLLTVTTEVVSERLIALTIKTPYIPDWELEEAKDTAKRLNVEHIIIESIIPQAVRNNPENRCYLCKSHIFNRFLAEAQKLGDFQVIDGTNADDTKDYRPGMKALSELGIKSPLLECNFGKKDIRYFSKLLGIQSWDKPAYACLLTRVPYNTNVSQTDLMRIEKAELYLHNLGFKESRVRIQESTARIEVNPKKISQLMKKPLRENIVEAFKKLGFIYVTLDIEGYQTGSMNKNMNQ